MLDPDVRELAMAKTLAILTTLMPDGSPQSSAVWPHADGEHLLVTTGTARRKYRNVAADPRVALLMLDGDNPRRYIEVRGRVVALETGEAALAVARAAFTKWTGSPAVRPTDGERVLLRIIPDRVYRKD
ncbi:PPOX class F420-dependent oxidoreductase [Actinocorallia sp. A-T 12471]|uniref:PPOX class F420-dependent oxidoreductase n=1 Tax=Actinocorallia sp. A-T 12471 TaxID=3089813 RepID=UPI0029CFEFD8|nr:PPOX class F420-dependent oxidoreductase [Actinocorallia sp. A-T 12471]MDX6744236.1 PPOX class F420-dependent oxidoreductase [Actinocorallia sp. A-T 12471]